jgi:hypothetical protein
MGVHDVAMPYVAYTYSPQEIFPKLLPFQIKRINRRHNSVSSSKHGAKGIFQRSK